MKILIKNLHLKLAILFLEPKYKILHVQHYMIVMQRFLRENSNQIKS